MLDDIDSKSDSPKPIDQGLSNYRLSAIEYTPDLRIASLDPRPGDIFHFFVDEKYTNFSHPPLAQRMVFGSPYYAPDSDISAISSHFGCLFQYHKRKSSSYRRLNTVRNALELCLCGEAEYHRRAQIYQFPLEARPRGVFLTICVDYAPPSFSQCNRNGIRSRDLHEKRPYSLRVAHFWLVSDFDGPIEFKSPAEFVRHKYVLPPLKEVTPNHEVFLDFDPLFLNQFLTRLNIMNGLFSVYRVFFEIQNQKKIEVTTDIPCNLILYEVSEEATPSELAKKRDQRGKELKRCELSEVQILPNYLLFEKYLIENIKNIILIHIVSPKIMKKDKLS